VTVSDAFAEIVAYVAVIVAVWFELTVDVETVNVAEVTPAGTVTVEGTDAALELDESATTVPPVGAAAERVTVP
jgi:hypothetical protein